MTTIQTLKVEALSALTADVGTIDDVPEVSTIADFEIARGIIAKGAIVPTDFNLLEDLTQTVKDSGIVNWEVLYLQFRDSSSGESDVVSIRLSAFVLYSLEYNNLLWTRLL